MNGSLDRALVNGTAVPLDEARLAITDDGVARGDGAFETVGVWDGRPFRLGDHLERLAESLGRLGLDAPDRDAVATETEHLLDGVDTDAMLRVYVTGSGTRIVTVTAQPQRPSVHRLATQTAPWIRPVGSYALAGVKSMSYAANMAATRAARRSGADDALLLSLENIVLEGPTFCVLWVRDGVVCSPAVELGIVDSISRRTILELADDRGYATAEGAWTLDELLAAEEIFICSSVREVLGVARVNGQEFREHGLVTAALSQALSRRRRKAREG